MSEQSEIYQGMREHSKYKRQQNRTNSLEILRLEFSRGKLCDHSVSVKNEGAHLIIYKATAVIQEGKPIFYKHIRVADFWPGTGKYKLANDEKYYRGVFNLIKELKKRNYVYACGIDMASGNGDKNAEVTMKVYEDGTREVISEKIY